MIQPPLATGGLPNPTANTGDNQVGQPLLLGLAKCQGCGTPMTMLDGDTERPPRYVCPAPKALTKTPATRGKSRPDAWTKPVLEHLIVDVLTDDLLQDVIAQVRRNAAQQALRQQTATGIHTGRESSAWTTNGPNSRRRWKRARRRMPKSPPGWPGRATAGAPNRTRPRQADHALRGYGYVADDEDRIESYARNPETYLRDMNAATTKSILELIVREVLVSADLVNIAYRLSLRMGTGVGKTHSVIPL